MEGLYKDKNLALDLYNTEYRINETIVICHGDPGALFTYGLRRMDSIWVPTACSMHLQSGVETLKVIKVVQTVAAKYIDPYKGRSIQ
ncbi:hypothetical protein FRX31_017462 [Thalictrum thalictroides]|uniref:Uncharacterized protein n=1 Tax=Thalictrum thalictroides TaxID=46969 RepID=A0A7J6W9Q2_THATH|nr:hypothetical protein FRX31_017462 [Thalictrum thalictroides]